MERRKALLVGVDNYTVAKQLHGCVNDARELAQLFAWHGDGSKNFDIELITAPVPQPDGTVPDADDPDTEHVCKKDGLSKDLLRERIKALFEGDVDIALFYFSGHGSMTSVGGKLITTETRTPEDGLEMNDILTWANKSTTHEKIIILDCCHSGDFGSSNVDRNVCEISHGMVVMTAALPSEEAQENKGEVAHGVFTDLLAEALNGAAADLLGQITPGSIYHYVDEALGSWEQRPVFKTNITRWTPLRQVLPEVPLQRLHKICQHFPDPDQERKLTPEYIATAPGNDPASVDIMKDLQAFAGVDLVVPVGEEHMYQAAMNSKACKLTALGKRYWRLVKHKRL
ncbi:MAG TPA: caspase family protein [Candidatus Angelobacter sp.]|nr:caspase family protein [Candidatus Angelobacter sp.]